MTSSKDGSSQDGLRLTKNLDDNVGKLKQAFAGVEVLRSRIVENQHHPGIRCCIFYTDNMVSNQLVNDNIIRPITVFDMPVSSSCILDTLMEKVVQINELKKTSRFDEIEEAIIYGDTVLLAQGCDEALLLNTKGWPVRGVSEPDSEKVLQGPREGFTEALLTNLAMLRHKLKTPDLKFKFRTFGQETKTKACICWIGRLAREDILDELERRLDKFDLDGALDTNYLTEYIKDAPYSIFRTVGNTERPDIVAAKLLEGRVAVFLDGTPMVLTVPHLFIENFQSNEDYYVNYWQATLFRMLRIIAFLITVCVPGFYVAATTTQQELLPTPLILSISVARQGVPFPTIFEILLMIIMFDVLRETGVRISSNVGQALSIVGALVVGQAAVEAKIVSAPVIIVVAAAGITSLIIPRMQIAVFVIRTVFIFLCFMFGLFGLVAGLIGLLIYLVDLRSFGLQAFHNPSISVQKHVDTFIRAPWWMMGTRPSGMSNDIKRRKGQGKPQP